jgi:CheY-like chemotaxis protein
MARILVVEDNSANLELITYLLEAFGHSAVPACDGEAGLEAARREAPDLIICDMQMPLRLLRPHTRDDGEVSWRRSWS